MSAPLSQRLRQQFQDGNPLPDLLLGLAAMLGPLDALLDRYAPHGGGEAPPAEPDPALDLLLGAVALRDRAEALLEQAAGAPRTDTVPGAGASAAAGDDLDLDLNLPDVLR